MMKSIGAAVLVGAGLVSVTIGADWPQFRGPNRDGISQEKGWVKTGTVARIVWEGQVGAGYSAVAIKGGRLYTMGNRGGMDVVACLDAVTGTGIWEYAYPCQAGSYPGPRCTPTVEGDSVYAISREGVLLCLDAGKGTVLWQCALAKEVGLKVPGWGLSGSPLVVGNLVIVNAGARGLAVDKATGMVKWSSGGGGSGYASPVLFKQGRVSAVLVFAAKGIEAVESATGKELWSHPWKTGYDVNAADPLVIGDKVLISSGYDKGAALLSVAGTACKVEWENKNLASHFSSPILWGSSVYGNSGNVGRGAELRCIDPATGAVRWSRKEIGFGSLILADGKLIVLNEKGVLSVAEASPEGYSELWSQKVLDGTCWTMPTLCNGLIYCRNDKGRLVCLNLSGK
jgi:outer membrane protein assembly factor BamB